MTKKRDTAYMHGKIYWARILPNQLHSNYNGDGRQWAFEFEPDEDSLALIKTHKLKDRLKNKYKQDGTLRKGYDNRDNEFIVLKRNEFDYEGEPNDPIRIVDAANQPWGTKTDIGNGSEVDLKVQIVGYGPGKKTGIYPVAIRVLDLVPFVRSDFTPLPEEDERVQKARVKNTGPSVEEDFGGDDGDTPDEEAPETPDTDDLDDDLPA